MSDLMFCAMREVLQMCKAHDGKIPWEVWRKLDQRPMRGLHKRGYIFLYAGLAIKAQEAGREALIAYSAAARLRNESAWDRKPLFVRERE